MKKYTLLFVSLLVSCIMLAQGPANRTAKTIAADVLAQMPAQNQETFNSLMNDLASSGEEGILILTQMLKAPGQGSNAQVEYALSGLTSYVSAPGREAQQAVVLSALNKAAAQATNATVKAFLENQAFPVPIGTFDGCIFQNPLCGFKVGAVNNRLMHVFCNLPLASVYIVVSLIPEMLCSLEVDYITAILLPREDMG